MTRPMWGGFVLLVVGIFVICEAALTPLFPSGPTCWKDPKPKLVLDFDFHTFVDGAPVRCGYIPPNTTGVLPRVLGEDIRAELSDILCYRMEPKPCEVKP